MKKKDLIIFINNFDKLKELEGFEFIKTITRNKMSFKDEYESLIKAKNSVPEMHEYENKKYALLKANFLTDEKGNFTKVDPEFEEEFISDLEILNKEYKKALEKQELIDKEFMIEIEKDIDSKLFTINEDNLPKNINLIQLTIVYGMVEWNN